MADELYFSPDGKSLRKGRRGSKRRPIERSVEIWRPGDEGPHAQGVAVDVSLEGVMVRTSVPFQMDDEVMIDIKRGKDINTPSFLYARGKVVRVLTQDGEQTALGIKMIAKERRPGT